MSADVEQRGNLMYFSRSLEDLHPRVAKKARALILCASEEDITLLVTCTYRDREAAKALHAMGRSAAGKWNRLTSYIDYHQWRMAFDVYPIRYGVPVWTGIHPMDNKLFHKIGEMGKALGLEWGGDWRTYKRELCHFQLTEGLTMADLERGKHL